MGGGEAEMCNACGGWRETRRWGDRDSFSFDFEPTCTCPRWRFELSKLPPSAYVRALAMGLFVGCLTYFMLTIR